MQLLLKLKRIYEAPAPEDGRRILVDRLWPRGISKEAAHLDAWLKEIAPSDDLRRWYGHDPQRWDEFRRRYREELKGHTALVDELRRQSRKESVTLLFAAQDAEHSNAAVLKEVIESYTKES
jgi:uncharacterized protein YeaO (DUF488 family)